MWTQVISWWRARTRTSLGPADGYTRWVRIWTYSVRQARTVDPDGL